MSLRCIDRRDALLVNTFALWLPAAVYAISSSENNALEALPPLDPVNTKRVFMCRHGETEYNRLGKVQGALIDAPLNETGERQAIALGKALSRVNLGHFYHSDLLRAIQTASIASTQLLSSPGLECLPSLKEIYFGGIVEGAPVSTYRAQMAATYVAWTMGQLDARMTQHGESLAQVQDRVRAATQSMLNGDASQVAAVSHSSYLRVFLSTVDKRFSMAEASSLQIPNCSIHVVDFDKVDPLHNGKVILTGEARHLVAI